MTAYYPLIDRQNKKQRLLQKPNSEKSRVTVERFHANVHLILLICNGMAQVDRFSWPRLKIQGLQVFAKESSASPSPASLVETPNLLSQLKDKA
jgi:hypothetical protein